jgi:hypothetical protein
MKIALLTLLASTGTHAPDVSLRNEVFHNDRVAAYLEESLPQWEDRDTLAVFVSGPRTGEVKFARRGVAQKTDTPPLKAVIVAFTHSQGYPISEQLPVKRQCNEGNPKACVEQKHLFCTNEICAEDVRMAPGAMRSGFASDDDQMLIAVTDYALSDGVAGGPPATHSRTSGQVEWVAAGSANRWTNTASTPAHFILIRFSDNR